MKKTEKKFSIIIPTYNSEKYIENAINSVRNQKCNDYEVIIVDDASIDKTYEVARAYREVTLYSNKVNRGPGIMVS